MKLKALFIASCLIAGVSLIYTNQNRINEWLSQRGSKELAVLDLSSDFLDKIGQGSSLFPEPLSQLNSLAINKQVVLNKEGIIYETNLQRQSNGLTSLKENTLLNKDANLKLQDLFEKQYFEHVSPTGVAPADLADKVGYKYIIVGENLALGNFETNKVLVEAWMNSPGHRANILNTRYLEIGVAVGKGVYQGQETWIAVQSFGTPLSSCPSVNTAEKQQIDTNRSQINQLSAQLAQVRKQLEEATYESREDYNRAVEAYNLQVEKFNELVASTKLLVEDYNRQVNLVNECIKK